MKRLVAVLDMPTTDGRTIVAPIEARDPVPMFYLGRNGRREFIGQGHIEVYGSDVWVTGVPWAMFFKYGNVGLNSPTSGPVRRHDIIADELQAWADNQLRWTHTTVEHHGATPIEVTFGPPTAYAELRRWWRR